MLWITICEATRHHMPTDDFHDEFDADGRQWALERIRAVRAFQRAHSLWRYACDVGISRNGLTTYRYSLWPSEKQFYVVYRDFYPGPMGQ